MDRDPKPFREKIKGVGAAFLVAISAGVWGDARAQGAPQESRDRMARYAQASDNDPEYIRECNQEYLAARAALRRRQMPAGSRICITDTDELDPQMNALQAEFDRAESPGDRARRRAEQAQMIRESDELSRYCESVNYVGERCRGL